MKSDSDREVTIFTEALKVSTQERDAFLERELPLGTMYAADRALSDEPDQRGFRPACIRQGPLPHRVGRGFLIARVRGRVAAGGGNTSEDF
jgi:hypothetical protein